MQFFFVIFSENSVNISKMEKYFKDNASSNISQNCLNNSCMLTNLMLHVELYIHIQLCIYYIFHKSVSVQDI